MTVPTSHRTWPLPGRKPLMRMSWHELLFMHWPVDVAVIRDRIPRELDIDTFDRFAWIGVVPFRMSGVAPRGVPDIPGLSAFPELNVRTYVSVAGEKPGVWFFSLDATKWLAVRAARRCFHLPYMDARIDVQVHDGNINYQCERIHRGEPAAKFAATYRPQGPPLTTAPGTLEHFLTARYCLYCASARGVFRGEINHPPWQIQVANCTVRINTMLDWLGIHPTEEPLLHYAHRTDVYAWSNEPI